MENKKRKSKYKGELNLAGNKIPCFVLEDGGRFLSTSEMQDSLKMTDESDRRKSGTRLDRYLNQKSLRPFLYKGKKHDHYNPTVFYDGNQKISGRKATLLVDFCDGMLEARKNIKLSPRQEIIANQCEILMRSFAKVGIIALVDEATGYQYEREQFELQKILKLLVLENKLFSKWKEMFSLGYYKDVFGVYDVDFTAENIKRKPRFIGWLTNELVYKNLPKGSFVLKEIKARTPKTKGGHYKKRFHQSLTPLGKKALEEIINTVRTLAWVSGKDRNKFRRLVKERLQLERELPYIDVEAMDDNKKETKFDKMLDTILNALPIKQKELKAKSRKKKGSS